MYGVEERGEDGEGKFGLGLFGDETTEGTCHRYGRRMWIYQVHRVFLVAT